MYLINAPFYSSTSKKQFPINCFCWDGRRDASPTLGFDILQSCFDRILANVVPVELQLGAGADDVIVAFILPDRSRGTDGLVDGFGGEGLPGVKQGGQVIPWQRFRQKVDMVRHEHELIQKVALSVKMEQGI